MEMIWPDVERYLPAGVMEVLQSNASLADRSARVPDESIGALRDCRYLSSVLPREQGGGGASLLEFSAMQRCIGHIDAGLAIGMTMHLYTLSAMSRLASLGNSTVAEFVADVAENQRVVCSASSEPNLGGAAARSSFVTIRRKGGYAITGRKTPVSLARLGSYAYLQFPDPTKRSGQVLTAIVPMKSKGMAVESTWDTLGARSSESNTLSLRDCFVPDRMIIELSKASFAAVKAATLAWYCIPLTAAYLGVASHVLSETKARLRKQKLHSKGHSRSELPAFQSALGAIAPKILMLECACAKLAQLAGEPGADHASLCPYALSLKYMAVDMCVDVVGKSSELIGGTSYGSADGVAKALRDIYALPLHAPNRIMSQQMIGRWMLGMTATLDYR